MPDLEKEEAIALFEDGNHSVELVRDWAPEALADLLASINWNYQGAPEVKGALQALYEQRRSEEAHRKRLRRVWGLAVAAVVVAILMLMLWEEYGQAHNSAAPEAQPSRDRHRSRVIGSPFG